MKYTVKKKKRTKGGIFWNEWVNLRYEVWCVLKDGKFFCEARSESGARHICMALNNDEEATCNHTRQTA